MGRNEEEIKKYIKNQVEVDKINLLTIKDEAYDGMNVRKAGSDVVELHPVK